MALEKKNHILSLKQTALADALATDQFQVSSVLMNETRTLRSEISLLEKETKDTDMSSLRSTEWVECTDWCDDFEHEPKCREFEVRKKNRFGVPQDRLLFVDSDRHVIRILSPRSKECRSEFPLNDIKTAATISLPKNHLRIIFQEWKHHRPYDVFFKTRDGFEGFMNSWASISCKEQEMDIHASLASNDDHGVGDSVYKVVRVTALGNRQYRDLILSNSGILKVMNSRNNKCCYELPLGQIRSIHKLPDSKVDTSYIDGIRLVFARNSNGRRATFKVLFVGESERTSFCRHILVSHQNVEFVGFQDGYPSARRSSQPPPPQTSPPSETRCRSQPPARSPPPRSPPPQSPQHIPSNPSLRDRILSQESQTDEKKPVAQLFRDVNLYGCDGSKQQLDICVDPNHKRVIYYFLESSDLEEETSFDICDISELTVDQSDDRITIAFESSISGITTDSSEDVQEMAFDLQEEELELDLHFQSLGEKNRFVNCIEAISPLETHKRRAIVDEIVASESTYISNGLEPLITKFLEPIKQQKILSKPQYQEVFSNIEEILKLHRIFYGELQTKENIPKIFADYNPFLRMYRQYIDEYDKRLRALDKLEKERRTFRRFLEMKKEEGLLIHSLLIRLVQRIPRYVLLLENLLKETPKRHQEYQMLEQQYNEMKSIAEQINESKRKAEKRKMFEALLYKLNDADDLREPHREFVETCMLHERGVRVQPRNIILMSDILVYTDMAWNRIGSVVLEDISFKLLTTEKFNGFELRSLSDHSKFVVFMCLSKEQQTYWKIQIQRLLGDLRKNRESFADYVS